MEEVGEVYYFSNNIIIWKIPNFSELQMREGERIYSPIFHFAPVNDKNKFKDPALTFEPLPGYIGLIVLSSRKIDTCFIKTVKFGIVNRNNAELTSCNGEFIEDNPDHFRVRSIIEERKVQKDYIRIFCESRNNCNNQTENGLENLSQDLEWLLIENIDSDLMIEVEEQNFEVHKAILRTRAPYFLEMFSDVFSESIPNIISITKCKANVFKEFLFFIYTGKEPNLSSDIACELYYIANKYNVQELKLICLNFIKLSLSSEMICKIIYLEAIYQEFELMEYITPFFALYIEDIINTNEWFMFTTEYPVEARDLLIRGLKLR